MIALPFTLLTDKINVKRQNNPQIKYYLLKNIERLLSRSLK
jgi:hypothetical protein